MGTTLAAGAKCLSARRRCFRNVGEEESSLDRMSLILLIMISFPEAMLVAGMGFLLVGVRPRLKWLVPFGALQAAASFFIRLSPIPFGLNTILQTVAGIVIIWVLTRLPVRLITFAAILGVLIEMLIEMVLVTTLPHLAGYSLVDVIHDPAERIIFFMPEAIVMAVIVWILLRFDVSLVKRMETATEETADGFTYLDKQYFFTFLLIILPIFLLGLENYAFYISRSGVFPEQHLNVLLFLIGAFVIVLAPLAITSVQKVGRAVAAESRLQELGETLRRIEELVHSARKQRHDFHHHLQTVYGLLETGCHVQAREYLQQTFDEIAATGALVATDNLPVSALLYTKTGVAEARNIRLVISVECSLRDLPLKPREINSLLGNLVDNALDAASALPPAERVVGMSITRERGRYVLAVTNRLSGGFPAENCLVPGRPGHDGLGLPIVRGIVEAYRGEMKVDIDGTTAVVTVMIPAAG